MTEDTKPIARDGRPGCPVTVWDGPYSTRCGAGASVGKCAHHGPFATTAPEVSAEAALGRVRELRAKWRERTEFVNRWEWCKQMLADLDAALAEPDRDEEGGKS